MDAHPRAHPPTWAAAAAAVVASFATDLQPLLEQLPVVSPATSQLLLVLAVGTAGGLIGRFAERHTMPWFPVPDGDGPDPDDLSGGDLDG